jgi:hypothetical protein
MSTTRHGLPATTHTVEMAQITDLNRRLSNAVSPVITAQELDMAAAGLVGGSSTLDGRAVLVRLSWEGSPEFPTVHGHFKETGTGQVVTAELHTHALKEMSRRLHLQQRWGI